jgi:hypothetical protein
VLFRSSLIEYLPAACLPVGRAGREHLKWIYVLIKNRQSQRPRSLIE